MTLPPQPNEIDALLEAVPDALADEAETVSMPTGMQPETVYPRQQQQETRQRRRTLQDTLLSLALDGQDERFKNKVYELVVELKLDPDDPLFLMLVATGRLELMLEEHPGELSTLFDQWEERVYGQLQNYQQGLEQYERTAVKAQQKAIAETVHTLGSVLDVLFLFQLSCAESRNIFHRVKSMVLEPIHCPACDGIDVIKHGTTAAGKQRYRCQKPECSRISFIREYSYQGYLPNVKRQISDMAINGSGIRDTARVLGISPTTVIEELKKRSALASGQ